MCSQWVARSGHISTISYSFFCNVFLRQKANAKNRSRWVKTKMLKMLLTVDNSGHCWVFKWSGVTDHQVCNRKSKCNTCFPRRVRSEQPSWTKSSPSRGITTCSRYVKKKKKKKKKAISCSFIVLCIWLLLKKFTFLEKGSPQRVNPVIISSSWWYKVRWSFVVHKTFLELHSSAKQLKMLETQNIKRLRTARLL